MITLSGHQVNNFCFKKDSSNIESCNSRINQNLQIIRISNNSLYFPRSPSWNQNHFSQHSQTHTYPSLSLAIYSLAGISLVLYKTKLIFFFRFLEKMSALADLINLDLSDSTEKIIAEYIWSVQFIHLYQIIFSLYQQMDDFG